MNQKTAMIPTHKRSLFLDITDAQSMVLEAESIAEKLVNEYDGDLKKIEDEISKIRVQAELSEMKDFNFKEEVLWAAGWIIKTRKEIHSKSKERNFDLRYL